ncbi:beta-ketoacyl synthase domain-containing protein [Colletotrichum tabaci]|uniref:Beta-ketoacyl synthase domain-containing protein n=1 Tax=Colletotrichum tabaci TaxID=1209068 RepID=A0AAV9ST40_9PEZI
MPSPIAVVGLACRLPDDVSSPEEFWQLLLAQRDTNSLPLNRWNTDAFHHPGRNKPQTIASRGAHFLKRDVTAFDAAFFNINTSEALALDPQQRCVMEVTYEALESAGITIDAVSGSRTGCYVGSSSSDYRDSIARDTETSPRYAALGINTEMLSNRTSWFYNLKGPSMTIATACSSSLVAIHMACQGLLAGETDMAVAGGVNLMLNPEFSIYLSGMTMISPEGHCKSFDASGDGYARGEGCGMVVLKRLDDAIRDNDPIRAIIRGTGVNSDGFTQGFTMPSSESQASLIREIYQKAELDMGDTQFVECHGTGTKAGDPIETRAIYETLGRKASSTKPLVIGSVKPNIGHLEGASGVAALIKSILALEKGYIPPQMFFRTPNPKIPFREWNLEIPTVLTPWPKTRGPRRVSINNFGVGGTNSHAIVEGAPRRQQQQQQQQRDLTSAASEKKRLFVFSSQDKNGLVRVAQSLAAYLDKGEEAPASADHAASLAYTLGNKRSRFSWKKFCVAADLKALRSGLLALTSDGAVRSNAAPRIGFVFTGQGAQWPLMGLKLLAFDVFKSSFHKCQSYLTELGCPWDAAEELRKPAETSRIKSPDLSQPLCTILQIGIVDLLASWNILPTRVVGHSSGEIAAAYSAGALSARDAVEVAYLRGKFSAALGAMEPNREGGGMLAVGCSREKAEQLIAEVTAGRLTVACVNSPSNVTISGDVSAIEQLHDRLRSTSVFVARLKVDVAYHSEHMETIYPGYVQSLTHIRPGQGLQDGNAKAVTMVSSVEAAEVDPEVLGAFYWGRNLVSPVLFSDALAELVRPIVDGSSPGESESNTIDLLVEIGPHAALKQSVKDILAASGIKGVEYLSSLSRGMDDMDMALSLAGNLFASGAPIDISKVNDDNGPEVSLLTDLPPYPWQHANKFDASPRISREHNMRPHPQNSLLGAPMPSVGPNEHVWRGYLRLDEENWVRDHKITGVVVYPGAGLVAMALEGARQLADAGRQMRAIKLRDVSIGSAAIISEDQPTEFVLHTRPHLLGTVSSGPAAWLEFTISSSGGADMPLRENCHGLMRIEYEGGDNANDSAGRREEEAAAVRSCLAEYDAAADACVDQLAIDDFYRDLANVGLGFGATFRNMQKINFRPGESIYDLTIGDPGETFSTGRAGRTHLIHPATLDSVVSAPFAAYYDGPGKPLTRPYIPVFIQEFEISADVPFDVGTPVKGFSRAKRRGISEIESEIYMFDEALSRRYLSIRGYRSTSEITADTSAGAGAGDGSDTSPELCYSTQWENAFGLLTTEELGSVVSNAGQTSDEKLEKIAKLIIHESPDTTVLEVLAEESETLTGGTSAVVTGGLAGSQPQNTRYAILGSSSLDGVGGEFLELKPGKAVEAKFDLVILGQGYRESINDQMSLSFLLEHLKPGGRLICGFDGEQVGEAVPKDCRVEVFADDTGPVTLFFTAPAVVEDEPSHALDASTPSAGEGDPTNTASSVKEKMLIIEPPAPCATAVQAFSQELVKILEGQGLRASVVAWTPELVTEVYSEQHTVVSLMELDTPFMESLSASDFALVQGLIVKATSLLWLTALSGPSASVIDGALRVARRELGNLELKVLHLSSPSVEHGPALAARVLASSTRDAEFLEDGDGLLKVSRVFEDRALNADVSSHAGTGTHMESMRTCDFPLALGISKPGLLDTLRFGPQEDAGEVKENEVEIQIKASGVNFRDVMISMGLIADPHLGYEGAGVVLRTGSKVTNVKEGDRVSAHVYGSHATVARTVDIMCARMPDDISFVEGASFPVVFTTAYHALVNLARLRPGQSVLIHAAAGGVGQAAIQLAQHLGLDIYVTVGSEDKRTLVMDKYGIPEGRIFNSRDASFVMGVKRVTGGRGVDCVLNSLAGELLRQSWYCLAPLGTFVEIGSRDVSENTRLDMAPFAAGTTFTCFTLLEVLLHRPDLMAETWRNTFDLIRKGFLRAPTPLTVMPIHMVKDAFRLMQSGKHRGKIVLSLEGNGDGDDDVPVPVIRDPKTALRLGPSGTYLLVGGLGGLGRSLAQMLVDSGARNIAFISRSGATHPSARAVVDSLAAQPGVNVQVYAADVADEASLAAALARCNDDLPPVKGVIQMAMVLRDGVFEQLTHDKWTAALRPKIDGSRNLHEKFGLRRPLDFFIMCSSISGVIGNRGQANYAAANAFQDALARHRRSLGLQACAVDLGIMRDVGVLAETGTAGDLVKWEELLGIREPTFHALMKTVINGERRRLPLNRRRRTPSGMVTDFPAQVSVGLATASAFEAAGLSLPDWLTMDARFAHLAAVRSGAPADGGGNRMDAAQSVGASLPRRIATAETRDEAVAAMVDGLVHRVSNILSTPASEVDPGRPLYMYGVDSLVAMEMRNWIQRDIKADIALFDVLEAVPMTKFAEKVVARSKLCTF